jgi:hypothetical protein
MVQFTHVDIDESYKTFCDEAAWVEAVETGKEHFGRWFLDDGYLITLICMPQEGKSGYCKFGKYYIDLPRLWKDWYNHTAGKSWVGEQGLRDLAEALRFLRERYGVEQTEFYKD